jgi:hypothetical protein
MICDKCGQRIRGPFKVPLSKNNISVLWTMFTLMNKNKKFVQTKEIYSLVRGGSPTAELSRLKYLGAIAPFFSVEDMDKESKRSGKWALTQKGLFFMGKKGTLPSYVVVNHEVVVERGNEISIDDPTLKWHSEDNIWQIMKEYWEGKKDKYTQVNLSNY